MRKIFILLLMLSISNLSFAKINSPKKEIECLAHNIYHESRGEPYKGKISVGMVVMNRTKSGKYPEDVCSVINQKGQFSWVGKKKKTKDIVAFNDSKKIAEYIYHNHDKIDDPTKGALYFNSGKTRKWNLKKITVIGNHKFYK